MKKLFKNGIFLLTIVSLFFACNSGEADLKKKEIGGAPVEILAENKTDVKMSVEGMVCAMGCAKFIEDKVASLEGIVESSVDFEEGTAYFEFDKTALSSEQIEDFINSIHDGQYKAKITSLEKMEEQSSSEDSEESLSSVGERVNINFPQLFTYFIKRIR